jgi:hypothetical protein
MVRGLDCESEVAKMLTFLNHMVAVTVRASEYLITFLLTPWSTVLLEKLTGLLLVKKFPTFYETRWFITAFTSVHQLSVS